MKTKIEKKWLAQLKIVAREHKKAMRLGVKVMQLSKLALILGLAILLAPVVAAQTNQFYNEGDLTVLVAPTLSIARGLNLSRSQAVGASIEADYWQTVHTATGLELGRRDVKQISAGNYIDHITALEKIRIVPFARNPFWGRFEFDGYTGAEEWFDDGSKGVIVGAGAGFAFTRNFRLAGDYGHQFETTVQKNGDRVRLGLAWSF